MCRWQAGVRRLAVASKSRRRSRSSLRSWLPTRGPAARATAPARESLVFGMPRQDWPDSEKGDHGRPRHEFVQQLKPLRPQRERQPADAYDVTTWPIQAGDKTVLDRVAPCLEDDWDRRGCRFCGEGGGSGPAPARPPNPVTTIVAANRCQL